MAEITQTELERLAQLLVKYIKEDFSDKHMSQNLIETIQIVAEKGEVKIIIPAQTYNMLLYQRKGVVVHTSNGSYADKLNETGSEFFIYPNDTRQGSYKIAPHNHVGYIQRAINSALAEWTATRNEIIASKVGL
jgi:hypothetical protein